MKRKENHKKEKNSEEKWYAWMNELEALWKTMIKESRLEYLESFNKMSKKPSKSKYSER